VSVDRSSPGVSNVPSLKISVTFGVLAVALGKNGDIDVGDNGGTDELPELAANGAEIISLCKKIDFHSIVYF